MVWWLFRYRAFLVLIRSPVDSFAKKKALAVYRSAMIYDFRGSKGKLGNARKLSSHAAKVTRTSYRWWWDVNECCSHHDASISTTNAAGVWLLEFQSEFDCEKSTYLVFRSEFHKREVQHHGIKTTRCDRANNRAATHHKTLVFVLIFCPSFL